MKIAIVGGAGFVGAELAWRFQGEGHSVIAMDNLVRRGSEQVLVGFRKRGVQFRHADARCAEDLADLGRSDAILLCAAQPSAVDGYGNPVGDFSNNTMAVVNVLEAARATRTPVIFWSTNKVYSASVVNSLPCVETDNRIQPMESVSVNTPLGVGRRSIYGASKLAAELWCQEYASAYGLRVIVNRFSCLAGPGQWGKPSQGWVSWWMIANELGLPITYFGFAGKQVRDVLFIGDIYRLVAQQLDALSGGFPGGVFTVGGGWGLEMSLRDMTRMTQEISGKEFASVDENGPERYADHAAYVSDIEPVKKAFGWKPTTGIRSGLDEISYWVQKNRGALEQLYAPLEDIGAHA